MSSSTLFRLLLFGSKRVVKVPLQLRHLHNEKGQRI